MLHDGTDDFDSAEPQAWFARRGLSLHVRREPECFPGLRVWGAWDPSIRRVTLYGSDVQSDESLVRTLGHELWHVIQHRRGNFHVDEAAAEAFGAALVEELGVDGVAACAGALQAMGESMALDGDHVGV